MVRHTGGRSIPPNAPIPNDEWDRRDILSKRLPTELIMEIFASCPPTVVSIACKHWREIALLTPHVWTKIYLDLKAYGYEQLTDLRQILLRSRDLPLFLFFLKNPGFCGFKRVHAEALTLLKEHCYRWTSVESFFPRETLRILFTLPTKPPLENLAITGNDSWSSTPPPRWPTNLAPTPSTVYLDKFFVESVPFSWSRITTFSGRMCGKEFARVVERASCLEELTVISFRDDLHERPVAHTVHTSLRVLEVLAAESVRHSGHLSSLFNSITLPTLESLHLPTDGKQNFDFVQRFFLRSMCPLTYLSLTHSESLRKNTFPLYEVLCLVPSLEEIQLSNMGNQSFLFLDQLQASTGLKISEIKESPFLPNLKHAFVQLKSKPAWIFRQYTSALFPPDEPHEDTWYRPLISIEIHCDLPVRTRYRGIHIDESGLETARKLERLQRRGCTAKVMVKEFDEAFPYDYASHALHQLREINSTNQKEK